MTEAIAAATTAAGVKSSNGNAVVEAMPAAVAAAVVRVDTIAEVVAAAESAAEGEAEAEVPGDIQDITPSATRAHHDVISEGGIESTIQPL